MKISLIAATTENNIIGKNGGMPWHLPDDLRYFMRTTLRHPIIMGRKTYETFQNNKPLPRRLNIVITRQQKLVLHPAVQVVNSLEDALGVARQHTDNEAFIIGGAEIYRLAMPLADRIYLTQIHTHLEGDTFFPTIDSLIWQKIKNDFHPKGDKNDYDFTFTVWERGV